MTEVLDNSKVPPPPGTVSKPPVAHEDSPPWRWNDWIALFGILLAFLIFAKLTWAHWGNLRVDCGRDMYLAQEIARGRMLYRDMIYWYGPLAPYWNGLLIWIFGEHLNVLYGSGLLITFLFALVFFQLSRRFVPAWLAFCVTFVFLLQAFRAELFNYILPYSYGATMGSLFALAFFFFLVRHLHREQGRNLFLAGIFAGMALVTKTEYGDACYLTAGIYLVLEHWSHRSARSSFKTLAVLLPGFLIPLIGWGYFIFKLSFSFFVRDSWDRAWILEWLRQGGFRFVPLEVGRELATVLSALLIWFALACAIKRIVTDRWQVSSYRVLLASALIATLYYRWSAFAPLTLHYALRWFLFPEGMFWLVCGIALIALVRWQRGKFAVKDFSWLMLCIYGLSVGARVMSKIETERSSVSVYYDTCLFLIFVVVLLTIAGSVLRELTNKRRKLALIVFFALEFGGLTFLLYPARYANMRRLATDRGTIYTYASEASVFPSVIQFMREKTREGKSVLIVPEETTLYFLSGTDAPTRWYVVHPGVLNTADKEQQYINQLASRKVDYILVSNLDYWIYGLPFWGIDFNRPIYTWIKSHYEVVGEFGQFSYKTPNEFGLLIYQRRPLSSP